MEAIVTRIKQLLDLKDLNYSQLAETLGYNSPEKISRLFRIENAKPSFDIVADIANKFADLNIDWLITGRGEMIKPASMATQRSPAAKTGKAANSSLRYEDISIPVTDIQVAAGGGYYNNDFISNAAAVHLPSNLLRKKATYLCVNIKGESMSPTLQDGGLMIIRLLEKSEWVDMQDERIYVVSSTEGKTYLKRIKNRLKQGFLVLMSDNPDKASYGNFNLTSEEINTIWYAEWYLSAKCPTFTTSTTAACSASRTGSINSKKENNRYPSQFRHPTKKHQPYKTVGATTIECILYQTPILPQHHFGLVNLFVGSIR
ncbi:S24 family peptidase [Paraflavitalea sp. CAU 1676]|uniref:XRE family transcriptional regulator n=1 Tax=Paraflavitalea sp. CAU 1676 TaxID=3032598 RepID=UPI0023DA8D62|nr:S24 family peptidase [Paraflavitalea sp. CAU 1676]MDF2191815.1 S24 family peptidase [Paraflavitalea sp. CAU 1676]